MSQPLWRLLLGIGLGWGLTSCFLLTAETESDVPFVRYDGLYQQEESDYSSYLRFYPDGTVVGVSAFDSPQEVMFWLEKNSPQVAQGKFTVQGSHLQFKTMSTTGQVDYSGTIYPTWLQLDLYSHKNGYRGQQERYNFVLVP